MNLLASHLEEHRLTDKLLAAAQDRISRWLAHVQCAISHFRVAPSQPLSPRAKIFADILTLVLGILAFIYLLWLFSEHTTLLPAGR